MERLGSASMEKMLVSIQNVAFTRRRAGVVRTSFEGDTDINVVAEFIRGCDTLIVCSLGRAGWSVG